VLRTNLEKKVRKNGEWQNRKELRGHKTCPFMQKERERERGNKQKQESTKINKAKSYS
jgi:hypothetical protein